MLNKNLIDVDIICQDFVSCGPNEHEPTASKAEPVIIKAGVCLKIS